VIVRRGDDGLAIGTECERDDGSAMRQVRTRRLAGADVPQTSLAVPAAGDGVLAVGAERDGDDDAS